MARHFAAYKSSKRVCALASTAWLIVLTLATLGLVGLFAWLAGANVNVATGL